MNTSTNNIANQNNSFKHKSASNKKSKWIIGVIFLLIAGISIYFIFFKKKPIANLQHCFVSYYSGKIEVKYSERGVWKKVKIGQALFPSYHIRTGKNSSCIIQIGENTVIQLLEDTEIKCQTLFYNKKTKQEKAVLGFISGKVIHKLKKLLATSEFEIENEIFSISVRGTVFSVETMTNRDIKVSVLEGKMTIKPNVKTIGKEIKPISIKGIEEKIELKNNQAIIIKFKGFEELLNLKSEAMNDIKDKLSRDEELDKEDIKEQIKEINKEFKGMIDAGKITKAEIKELGDFAETEILSLEKPIGRLSISSIPENSEVVIDDKPAGITPFGKMLGAGKYNISIKKEGYESFDKEVFIRKRIKTSIDTKLKEIINPVKWKIDCGGSINSKPVIWKDKILVTINNGPLLMLDMDGNILWTYKISKGICSPPAVTSEGKVLFAGNDEYLYCIDIKSKKLMWKKKVGLLEYSSPVIDGNYVYVGAINGRLAAFNIRDGGLKWKFRAESGIYSPPALHGNKLLFASEDSYLYCLDKQTGKLQWKFKTSNRIISSSPVVEGETVYIGNNDGAIYAVELGSGKLKWQFEGRGKILASPVIYNNIVYIGTVKASFYALDVANGKLQWQKSYGKHIENTVSIYEKNIYLAGDENKLYIINIQNGNIYKKLDLDSFINTSPVIKNNILFIGTTKGILYTLDLNLLLKTEYQPQRKNL